MHLGEAPRGGLSAITAIVGGGAGIVNLEGPVAAGAGGARVEAGRAGAPATVWLANPLGAPAFLREQGVVAASVANNHAGDDGAAGVDRTRAALAAAGVSPFGAAAGPARLVVEGVDVALFAYDLRDGGARDLAAGIAAERAAAARAAAPAAVEVVALHVTGPPSYLPRPELVVAVDAAVAAGADIVVAHGTHVVGPVERRGDAVIAWGLGNLLFDCACTTETEALVLRVELTAGLPARVFPVAAGLGGAPATPAPDPHGVLDLVAGLGGSPLTRLGASGRL